MRVGIGTRSWRFDPTRVLMLGGVKVPGSWGLRGPGDADALLRAIGDAMLGAAGLGDLEDHFPGAEASWAQAPSAALLAECVVKLAARGLAVVHVDSTLHAERPDLRAERPAMQARVAALLGTAPEAVNVKTAAGGPLGADGVGALAVVTLEEIPA